MVNSGSFDSDVDRNEKGEFTQPRRIAESPQSASSVHAVSGSLCENDFTTQTADSLPPASQAIEPTATKTEYKCSMSDLLLRARKILTSQCDSGDVSASRANNDVYYTHETSIVAEGYPTEIGKSEEALALLTSKEEDITDCKKIVNKNQELKTKVSVCCSVPLEKVQNILKACRSSTDNNGSEKINFQNRKQISSKKDMCLYCDRTFVTSTLKQKHVDRYHSLKYNRRLSTRRQVAAKHSVTACIFCDKLNNIECNLKELFKHLVTEHPKKYFGCLQCEIRFQNFKIFENHNIKIHGASKETEEKICDKKEEDLLDLNQLDTFLGKNLEKESLRTKLEDEEANSEKVLEEEEEKNIKSKRKRQNGTRKKEEEKRKSLPTLSVTLEPLNVFPNDKVTVSSENNFFVKEKSKINWVKELRSKKVSVVSTKMGIKQCLRITRQQNKTMENIKNTKRKVKNGNNNNTKNEHNNTSSINTKYLSFQNHPYTTFDVSFRVKKITDHSIDNIKISSLTFDDVFDKAFFNRVKCNIQENLLNFVDGKLFKSVESENRISSFQKSTNLQLEEPTQPYGCKLSTNLVSPVTTSLLTDPQISEDIDSQIETTLKPSKKKGTTAVVNDEVHYKYFTRRKYQAVISENKQHRDLSKLDMWTQLIVKNRQQKIMTEQKTDKEIIEYKKSDEYKLKMQVEELDRILDKRGPLEDLKEEAIRTVALEKLNGTSSVDSSNIESYFDVTIILNQLLNSVFTTETSLDLTREDLDLKSTPTPTNTTPEISQVGEEMPTMLNLRRISYSHNQEDDSSQKLPNNEDKTVMMEMTGEWARSRIYVCAACGIKMPNTKLLIDHKNLFHEHVWCQHYEFVGNQGELYRHLSIPGLGKVGEIESSGSKMWRRSDARTCSKCNKQFNCLGDLHRHVLECGGDWSWMLARKKYKYRPYGSKPRKRRRGLLKFLHTFRERKEQSREKGKTIKKFDGPRQKPSDADTIERMLANLPAKRITRKIMSLKDGLQRTIKNPKLSKTNQTKSLKQKKIQVQNKAHQKNTKDPVKNSKKSRRLLRSNSNIMFENQINLIKPKYKKERKEMQNDNKSNSIRRHSVRNISRVLSNKLVKANQVGIKSKINDKKVLKINKSPDSNENVKKNENESNLLPKLKKKNITNCLEGLKNKKLLKIDPEKKTAIEVSDPVKKKPIRKGKVVESTPPGISEEKVEKVEVSSLIKNIETTSQEEKGKVKVKSTKVSSIKKSASLNNIDKKSKPQLSHSQSLDLVSKSLNSFKSIKKKKKNNVNKEIITSEASNKNKNKKSKFTFNLRKSKLQNEHKNVETNNSGHKKNNTKSNNNLNSVGKKIKKTITKIIQVDGSSQNKPSTRSKRFKKELPQTDFLSLANNKLSPTSEDIPEIILPADSTLPLLDNFSEAVNITESANSTEIAHVEESNVVKEDYIETALLPDSVESKPIAPEISTSSLNPTAKKRIAKKQRGLNDCIAMLTNKLQDKVLNNEPAFLTPIIEELPNNIALTDSNKFLEEDKGENLDKIDVESNNSKNNKENFDSNLKLQPNSCDLSEASIPNPLIASCFWERLDKHPVDQINCKYTPKDDMVYENGLIYNCIAPSCPDDKEDKNHQKLTPPSNADISRNVENQGSILQLMEQNPLAEGCDDNGTKQVVENPHGASKFKSDMDLLHDFNQKYHTENGEKKNLKRRKHRKKNFHTKLQNSRKSLRNRYGNYVNKQEKLQNCTRTDFSNTITEINQSEIIQDSKFLTENEQTVVLSTSEEFSNSGKENIKRAIKISKHKKIKHVKGISKRKKNAEALVLENDQPIKSDALENPVPKISEFVDSDDDVPLAAFVKKDFSKTNLEDALESQSYIGTETKSEEELINKSVIPNVSQEEKVASKEQIVSNENCLPKLDETVHKEIGGTKARKGRKKLSKKPPKPTVKNEKKNTKRKKRIKVVISERKTETPPIFIEDPIIPIDSSILKKNNKEDENSFFSSSEARNLVSPILNEVLNSNTNPETVLDEPENLDNYYQQIDKTIDIPSSTIISTDGNTIAEPLEKQTAEEDVAKEDHTEHALIEESTPLMVATDTSITKSKPKARLKTIYNNKRNGNGKKKIKPQAINPSSNIFCDICNKTFTRSENLLKHKRTLTHIAKLSELEALQAAEKLKQDNPIVEDILEDNLITENIDVNDYEEEYPKNPEISTFTLGSSQESLKLVDIISDVLSKPIDDDFVKPNNFSGLILQSDHETKRCKSLGERKSFDSDKLLLSPSHSMDLNEKFVTSKLSNTADIIVEKQISLLENMIEDNRVNFKSSDRIFSSSSIPTNEEYSNQSSSSEFSLLSSTKQEEGNDITFTHNTNIITNLIKPTLDEDNLMHSTQYEEISEDSSSSHFQVEEQKSRKALNRDEELFLECCSLLKSSSDISDLCKKPPKSAQFLNNFGLKPLDEFEWLEQKQLPTKKTADFEYITNNFISEDSRMNVSVSDNFYNDLSYSNSNMSNSNLNLKVLLDQNVNDQLFSQPPPIFEDISTESEGSSGKSLGSCLKTISSAIALNEQDVVYDKIKIKDQLSPSVESAQIPEEHEGLNRNIVQRKDTNVGDGKSKAEKNKISLHDPQDIILPVPKTIQASITDYAVPTKIKKNQNKKMLTKGAMKVFEGLKVSIPKDGIDMKEVLSCSPTSKRLQLEAEEENSANKKSCSEKLTKSNSTFNKIINNSESIKKIGNSLGLKITKKKFLPVKIKVNNNMTTQNENKSHDIYDFEETQDIMDTFTSSNSNSLPIYRSFRNKITEKSNDACKNTTGNRKKSSEFHHMENKTDDEESQVFNDHLNNKQEKEKPLESPSKKIDMCKSITKKKCMIMGRIFKNAVKSKIGDEIKNIPAIENAKIVENFVLNCQTIQSDSEIDKDHKLSEEEMNTIFDNLLKDEKSEKKHEEINESLLGAKNIDHKPKHKINRCKKRHRGNSSDFSDEEFSIKKFPKRPASKKNSKNNECVINLEQELKECIGVASRKSQRKCTSGKQNVLVEYWSSDESSFETDHNIPQINYLENIPEVATTPIIENIENNSRITIENETKEDELCEIPHETPIIDIEASNLKKKSRKLINNGNKLLKPCKNGDITSSFEVLDSPTIASCRRKRTAVDTLYYWSSSSEDELQDIIEVKPLREEYDDEERPLQHGWIVGDSPKKLVTMLAQAKGKKLDVECVKKNKKNKRTGV